MGVAASAGAGARRALPRGSWPSSPRRPASTRALPAATRRAAGSTEAENSASGVRAAVSRRSRARAAGRRGSRGLPSRYHRRAKMPSTLMWRCRPMRSNQRRNFAGPGARGERADPLAKGRDPGLDPRARPGDVAVLQQRHEVVADRPVQGILEVEDARIGPRLRPSGCASDSRGARTRAAAPAPRHQQIEGAGRAVARGGVGLEPEMPRENQSGNRLISRAALRVVGRQLASGRQAAQLDAHQRVHGVAYSASARPASAGPPGRCVEPRSVSSRKPSRGVARQHLRHMDVAGGQQPGDPR